jgi:hypothetical protein
MKSSIIAYSNFSGQDLYHGSPDLTDAKVVKINTSVTDDYYCTLIELELKNGFFYAIDIRQAR